MSDVQLQHTSTARAIVPAPLTVNSLYKAAQVLADAGMPGDTEVQMQQCDRGTNFIFTTQYVSEVTR
ncbi:hypothetical protein PBI_MALAGASYROSE_53 [Mycobacterium phage MalagasyRose]|uniref:Uncharacterized protein n=1 Tax=Mycobacterium phage MalagasyRose TaxID=2599870 RepID=A0A5J6TDA6_9CAUD|nr:hypothetical protein QEH39_gp35 [Mycobacterium phage MalagasyRose]QFG08901.1 hypothetical protein PBI_MALAGASYROSE_53 [Mycobacterium phage MalagasyRose]